MASSILRRAYNSKHFNKLICPASASSSSSFNVNSQVTNFGEDGLSVDIERRTDRSVSRRRDTSPSFFADVFDPFSRPTSLSQVHHLMDQFMDNPFLSRGMGSHSRRGWDVKEDDDYSFTANGHAWTQ